MVNLDGSRGEGGGQMLRTALVWSLVTGRPFRMDNIRARRPNPGLKPQHVQVLQSLRFLGPVRFEGAVPGSPSVTFHPAPLRGSSFRVDIGTAGSVTLLLQTLLPALLVAEGPGRVEIIGGTDVPWSPPADFLKRVVLELVAARSRRLSFEIRRRGFYPKGGGEVVVEAEGPLAPLPFSLTERGALREIRIISFASEELASRRVSERQAEAAAQVLAGLGGRTETEVLYGATRSSGSVLVAVAGFEGEARLGAGALGERGKPAEEVGRQAARALAQEIASEAAVDEHATDQLVPWLAFCGGSLRASRLTEHTRTNMWVTEQFTGPLFEIHGTTIHCTKPVRASSRS